MLTLFHAPNSRSSNFIWLLEELGVDYRIAHCIILRRSGRGAPDPANPHPEKRVPALQHVDERVTEQAAIALYLTDSFPQAGLGPVHGAPGRARYLGWLAFFAGEADPVYNARLLYGARPDPMTLRDQVRVRERVDGALAAGPYLLGEDFSAADVLMSGPLRWDPELGGGSVLIAAWLARLAARPAAQRAAQLDERPLGELTLRLAADGA